MPHTPPVRVMIVEDDMLQAMHVASVLDDAGIGVQGPFPSVALALRALDRDAPAAAILDMDLNGTMSYPVADALTEANVPFLWFSGSSEDMLPDRFRGQAFIAKPLDEKLLLRVVTALLKTS